MCDVAETRARRQLNLVRAAGLQAERAGDVAIGAALTARDNVVDTARKLGAQRPRPSYARGVASPTRAGRVVVAYRA